MPSARRTVSRRGIGLAMALICLGLSGCSHRRASGDVTTTDEAPVALLSPEEMATPLPCPVDAGPVFVVAWVEEDLDERWGAGWRRFEEVQTTVARPVEVCGVQQQVDWLYGIRCPNGRRAFANQGQAHGARSGGAGTGGRCGTQVDVFSVRCGSESKRVFMDMYHCGPGESPLQGAF